jgi:Ca2+:H+ antiporter
MPVGIDSIKRSAHREAWYSDSLNPFRKTTRSSSWAHPPGSNGANRDLEEGDRVEDQSPLSAVQTEPLPEFPSRFEHDSPKPEEAEMTKADASNGRVSDPASDTTGTTTIEKSSTRETAPEKKGVFSRFKRKKNNTQDGPSEPDDAPKKRPWYKGKILKHKPFTVRNQLGATIFNSWINILLVAAPVGIGLNYAGVDGKVVFCVNFIAIIPLAAMLSFATEEIALHVGESLGGLLNASFGYIPQRSPQICIC